MNTRVHDFESHWSRMVLGFGTVVLLVLLGGLAAGLLLVDREHRAGEDRLEASLGTVISDSVNRVSFSGRYHAQLLIESYVEADPDLVYVRIVEHDGAVYAEAGELPEAAPELGAEAEGGARFADLVVGGRPVREVVTPFRSGFLDEEIGVVRIGVSREHGLARLRRNALVFVFLGLFSSLVALYLVVRSSRRLAAPVQALAGEFAGLLEHAPLAVAIEDREGVIRRASASFEELFGGGAPVAGRALRELVDPAYAADLDAEDAGLRSGRSPLERAERRHRSGGRDRVLVCTRFPLERGGGQPESLCTVALDVTDQRELEQSLLQARRMESIGQFAGGVAHDFNNILTGIAGATDLIDMADGDPRVLRDQAAQLRSLVSMAAGLTSRLLSFGRKQVTVMALHDLNRIVADLQPFLGRIVREDVRIEFEPGDADAVPVVVDRGQIDQVLLNLVSNARDAMPTGGRVRVQTGIARFEQHSQVGDLRLEAGAYGLLRVSDEGTGIPERIRDSLFDPFATTKGLGEGTGLGLSIVYGIVAGHSGVIGFDTAAGEGTTFSVYLPLSERPIPTPDAPTPAQRIGARAGLGLLVVEDNLFVRNSVVAALRRMGHDVWEAADGQEGLELFQGSPERFDAVLVDVVMPRLNGAQVAEAIREISTTTPILFMTGYDDDILDGLLEGDPLLAWIQKPFTVEGLADGLAELLVRVESDR